MSDPFAPAPKPIPVTVVASGEVPEVPGAALLTLAPPLHTHAPGSECPACLARGDIRALLFDLLTEARTGTRPEFSAVIVDARALGDAGGIVAALSPNSPVGALRDRTVMRSFRLAETGSLGANT